MLGTGRSRGGPGWDLAGAEVLAEVAGRVDRAALADRMVEALRSEIDAYRRLPEAVVRGDVLVTVRANVELFRAVLDGYEPGDVDLEPFRQAARDRVSEGVTLDDLLHAYRLAARVGWTGLVEAATPEESTAMLRSADLLMQWLDRVSAAVAESYHDERRELLAEEEARARGLLDALADGQPLGPAQREAAERLRFSPEAEHRPFVLVVSELSARGQRQLASELRGRGALACSEGDRVMGLAPAHHSAGLLAGGRAGALVAVGDPVSPEQCGSALDEVRLAAEVASRLGRTGEVTPGTLVLELLLARAPRQTAQVCFRVVAPLTQSSRGRGVDLIETLETFVASGLDRRRAAARLHVHPNTLGYRLRRIERICDVRFDSADDLALIALALKARALTGCGECDAGCATA